MKENRFVSRNKVWPETDAVVTYRGDTSSNQNKTKILKEKIHNLSSQGMFLKTDANLMIDTKLDIQIDFNPGKEPEISLKAKGVVLRSESDGVAVMFTKINTDEFGKCIIQKIRT